MTTFALAILLVLQEPDAGREVRDLIGLLASDVIQERDRATLGLKRLGKAAVPELEKASRGADAEIALRASQLLRVIRIQDRLTPRLREAFPGIDERFASGPENRTEEFVKTAERWRTDRSIASNDLTELAVLAALGARTSGDKEMILKAVKGLHLRAALPAVDFLLSDADPIVRRSAVRVFGDVGRSTDGARLRECLKDEDSRVRALAANALGQCGVRAAAPDLLERCNDPSPRVRRAVAEALGELRIVEAAPQLAGFLSDADEWVRADAARALADIWATDRVPGIIPLLSDPHLWVRGAAAEALGRLGARDAAEAIAGLLEAPEREIWGVAAEALACLDARAAGLSIVKVTKDRNWQTRRRAAWALGRLRVRETIPRLLEMLEDSEGDVRNEAARALATLGAAEAVGPLTDRLKDNRLQFEAASALCELGSTEGVPVLLAWRSLQLHSFNALARPEAWKALGTAPWKGSPAGSLADIRDELARQIGLPVEGELADGRALWTASRPVTVREVLIDLARYRDVILEADRIRIVATKDAAAHWSAWWEQRGVRK